MNFINAHYHKPDENEEEVLVYIESTDSFDVAYFKHGYNFWQGKKQQYTMGDVTAFCRIDKESLKKFLKNRSESHDKKSNTGPAGTGQNQDREKG